MAPSTAWSRQEAAHGNKKIPEKNIITEDNILEIQSLLIELINSVYKINRKNIKTFSGSPLSRG